MHVLLTNTKQTAANTDTITKEKMINCKKYRRQQQSQVILLRKLKFVQLKCIVLVVEIKKKQSEANLLSTAV